MLTKWSVVTRLSTKWSAVEAGLSRHTPLYANLTSLGKSAAACFSRREERFALKVARKAKSSLNNPALEFSLKKERSCRIFNVTLRPCFEDFQALSLQPSHLSV